MGRDPDGELLAECLTDRSQLKSVRCIWALVEGQMENLGSFHCEEPAKIVLAGLSFRYG
jgi:hypothetical protein